MMVETIIFQTKNLYSRVLFWHNNDIINIERNDLVRVIIQVTTMSYTTDATIIVCLSFQSPPNTQPIMLCDKELYSFRDFKAVHPD